MEDFVNAIAFPAPRLPKSFYAETLLSRNDLVWLRTSLDERIPALHLRAPVASKKPQGRGLTILYAHGNAEDLGLHVQFVEAMARKTGCDVFSFEYVGYGLSGHEGGRASEDACYRSIAAAWTYLSQKVDPSTILVYGRSIGTGPAVDLCAGAASPRGLLLQSPFESGLRCAFGYVTSVLLSGCDIFRNYEKIDKVSCPIAIVHGTEDTVVPIAGARTLLDLARNAGNTLVRELFLTGYGHNDMPYPQVFRFLHDEFLKDINTQLRQQQQRKILDNNQQQSLQAKIISTPREKTNMDS